MSRMLEITHAPEPRREPNAEADRPVRAAIPISDAPLDDDSGVPFIEVGAPIAGTIKAARSRVAAPTIIPMPRPTKPETPRLAMPPADDVALFHISFQPLPFPERPDGTPNARFARDLVAFHQPDHPISEQYTKLMTEVQAQLGTDTSKALLFSSALPGAGTTSVLLNLAVTCARREGAKVVVVDANLDRPAAAARLGCAAAPGLREALARTVPLAWCLQETGQPNLTVLTGGTQAGRPVMDLWPVVLDQLRQRFEWVLIDGAECGSQEWPALAGTATATYLVLRQADLEKPELNDMLTDVSSRGGRLRGYILTQR